MGNHTHADAGTRKSPVRIIGILVLIIIVLASLAPLGLAQLARVRAERLQTVSDPDVVITSDKGWGYRVSFPDGTAEIDADDNLVFEADGKRAIICEEVSILSWDGESVLYYHEADKTLCAWKNGDSQPVFTWDGDHGIRRIYGAKDGILFWDALNFYLYSYSDGSITPVGCPVNVNELTLVYENWLISIWGNKTHVTAYHLTTGETVQLDITRPRATEGDRNTSVTVASRDNTIYLSLQLLEGTAWVEGTAVEGTYAIDLETWKVEQLSDKYYEELFCTEEGLYGKTTYRLVTLCAF